MYDTRRYATPHTLNSLKTKSFVIYRKVGKKFSSNFYFVLAILFAVFLGFTSYTQAASVEELKKVIEQKNQEIKRLGKEAEKYRTETVSKRQTGKTLKAELARIDKTVGQLRKDIRLTESKLQKTELEIKKTSLEIKEKETVISKLQKGLTAILRVIFETDHEEPIKFLFKQGGINSFWEQLEYNKLLQSQLLQTLENLHIRKGELKTKKEEAEEKKDKLAGLEKTLEANKKITEGVRKERKDLLTLTKNQEEVYQKLVVATEQRQEEILREVEDLEESLRLLVDPSSLPKAQRSFFEWPIDGILSQGYGQTPFTKSKKGKHFYKFHNGIDIAAPTGTPIKAGDDGIVLGTGNTDNYCLKSLQGKYTVIDHENNLATMYAHQSLIIVSPGQQVKRGDVIGYVGSTGKTTGPHLHFTVYDSRTLEIKRGPTGACGPIPIGGSVDPTKYL